MNGHLTEQQLIDYEFKLASDAAMAEARSHVQACDECRAKLEALKAKLAALDVLREEVKASEALVAQAVAGAGGSGPRRIIPFAPLPWLGATAAVIIVGVALLLVSPPGRGPQPKGPSAQGPAPVTALEPDQVAETETPLAPGRGARKETMAIGDASTDPIVLAATVLEGDDVMEKPPFAPASAIELVVLPRRENVQLTIYNAADLTLVRERRSLTLKRGWNWLQFMWAETLIDPTSLSLEPTEHTDQVEIQQLVFPPRLRELGRWLIRSEVSGRVPFELTYLTSGLAWRAFYMGTLSEDETKMRLEGYVRVDNNSGEEYENAQTRLIVGKVHLLDQIRDLAQRQYAYGAARGMMGGMGGFGAMGRLGDKDRDDYFFRQVNGTAVVGGKLMLGDRKEIRKEGLSEYFLYTIEGTETIPNQWGKRLLSFETDDIPVEGLYKYDEQRWGTDTIRFLSFANDEEHELGQTPLPDGTMRIYGRADAEGHLAYVGGTDVKYIPVGEEIELPLGPASLVEVEPVLMEFRTENYVFDNEDDVAGWDEVRTWKVEITNARTLPVEIEVTRGFETPYWTLTSDDDDVSYEKHDATHARFKLDVLPRGKQEFEYTVTTYHGVREATWSEIQLKTRN